MTKERRPLKVDGAWVGPVAAGPFMDDRGSFRELYRASADRASANAAGAEIGAVVSVYTFFSFQHRDGLHAEQQGHAHTNH
jgi:hypothetical protein